jgi:hypothetical protein
LKWFFVFGCTLFEMMVRTCNYSRDGTCVKLDTDGAVTK